MKFLFDLSCVGHADEWLDRFCLCVHVLFSRGDSELIDVLLWCAVACVGQDITLIDVLLWCVDADTEEDREREEHEDADGMWRKQEQVLKMMLDRCV